MFGRVFLTSLDSKSMEILCPTEFFRIEGACSHVQYYLLGQLDSNKMLDIIGTKMNTIMKVYNQIGDYFLKLTGTSMMNLVVKLVSLSKFDSNDKHCAKGITELREIKQKFIQRKLHCSLGHMPKNAKDGLERKKWLKIGQNVLHRKLYREIIINTRLAWKLSPVKLRLSVPLKVQCNS